MENNLNWSLLIPTFLILFQIVLFLILAFLLLRRVKLITSPIAETEASAALIAGTVVLGMLLISTSSIGGLYKSSIFEQGVQVYTIRNVFGRFGPFFFVIASAQFIFLNFSWFLSNMLTGKDSLLEEARAGNLSLSILFGFTILSIAIGCFMIAQSVCDLLIPATLNFR